MKELPIIRSFIKFAWRHFGLRTRYLQWKGQKLVNEWEYLVDNAPDRADADRRVLIIPSDPVLISRSTGDQAMIDAIKAEWTRRMPDAKVYVATVGGDADLAAGKLGLEPLPILQDGSTITDSYTASLAIRPDVVILMGADGVDGSYDPSFSVRNVALVDLLSRSGAEAYITGFSVSRDFHPLVTTVFDRIDENVAVNLRDPVSFARFTDASDCSAREVADVAFLLKPQESRSVGRLNKWIDEQRSLGRTVLGLNFHPLLLELDHRSALNDLIEAMAEVVEGLLKTGDIAILLIDHDERGSSSDALCLRPLYEMLTSRFSQRLLYPEGRLSAPEIKALSSQLDGVISGRMHLMIASIGAATPTFGIDYKDKMEGLLQLCELDCDNLASAETVLADPNDFRERIMAWIADLEAQRSKVVAALPSIRKSALKNFAPLK